MNWQINMMLFDFNIQVRQRNGRFGGSSKVMQTNASKVMRTIIIVFLLLTLCCASKAQIIATHLILDLQADTGVTVNENGCVTNWLDVHSLLNNDSLTNNATQPTNVYAPLLVKDCLGRNAVYFQGNTLTLTLYATNVMWVSSNLTAHSKTCSVYAVCSGPIRRTAATICAWTNWPYVILGYGESPAISYGSPLVMLGPLVYGTSVFPAANPGIFYTCGSSTNFTYGWNGIEEYKGSALPASNLSGLTIGDISASASTTRWDGYLYRLLIYRAAHTSAERAQITAALVSRHNILTNYSKLAVCTGDSTVEGVGVSSVKCFSWDLAERVPEIAIYNYGVGSRYIQTNGASGNVMYGQDSTKIDPLFNSSLKRNWEIVQAGINDINSGGLSGQNTYGRMTNYCAQRLAAHPWEIAVCTLASHSSTGENTNYNDALRTQTQNWTRLVDYGYGSKPADMRLWDTSGSCYYDAVHQNDAGHAAVAQHILPVLNTHRRVAGFM
jgi:lysophospholipase L1-like esterase